ncbi:GrpB family protein [Nocardiopsis sediminis]|uniref:GrpB family protein n=1 Tax=Nocardiopsis sediminis TaxID=1778267 RepID=A0ABV8FSY2_9ACTN
MSPSDPLPLRGRNPADAPPAGRRLVDGRVPVADYDVKWPYLFHREAGRIRQALGDSVLDLQHVGSTSVPGLTATPCVDLLLLVADPADEDAYLPPLAGAGYTLVDRDPGGDGRRLFKGPDVNIDLHVLGAGSGEADRMLRFRDHLRTHPGDHELYASTKRGLAERRWESLQDYADAKSPVIDEIMSRS